MNEVFRPAENIRISTRNSYLELSHPFQKTSTRQNGLSYIGPAISEQKSINFEDNQKFEYFQKFDYYLNHLSNPNL